MQENMEDFVIKEEAEQCTADVSIDGPDSGIHEPDFSTVRVEPDGEWYVDVQCGVCGRSGCIGTLEVLRDTISW